MSRRRPSDLSLVMQYFSTADLKVAHEVLLAVRDLISKRTQDAANAPGVTEAFTEARRRMRKKKSVAEAPALATPAAPPFDDDPGDLYK